MENHDIEVIWTLLPVLIFIAIPRLRLFHLIEKSFESIIYAKVIGRQWYWSYDCIDFDVEYDPFILRESVFVC